MRGPAGCRRVSLLDSKRGFLSFSGDDVRPRIVLHWGVAATSLDYAYYLFARRMAGLCSGVGNGQPLPLAQIPEMDLRQTVNFSHRS